VKVCDVDGDGRNKPKQHGRGTASKSWAEVPKGVHGGVPGGAPPPARGGMGLWGPGAAGGDTPAARRPRQLPAGATDDVRWIL